MSARRDLPPPARRSRPAPLTPELTATPQHDSPRAPAKQFCQCVSFSSKPASAGLRSKFSKDFEGQQIARPIKLCDIVVHKKTPRQMAGRFQNFSLVATAYAEGSGSMPPSDFGVLGLRVFGIAATEVAPLSGVSSSSSSPRFNGWPAITLLISEPVSVSYSSKP